MLSLDTRAGCSRRNTLRGLAGLVVAVAVLAPAPAGAVPIAGAVDVHEVTVVARPWRPLPALDDSQTVFVGPAPTPRAEDGTTPVERGPSPASLGEIALAAIGYDWRAALPGWRITFAEGEGPLRGLTDAGRRRITVYVGRDDGAATVARVVAHELGHAVDVTYNDTSSRREWKRRRGIGAAVAWWPTPGLADFATGSGDFAECFAQWQLAATSRSGFGACSDEDIEVVAATA